MRLVAPLLALFLSSPAFAGGIGPMVMGGFHVEDVAWYRTTTEDGNVRIPDSTNWPQTLDQQFIGNGGGGLEMVLGDRDNLVQGVFRFWYMFDAPQANPAPGAELVDPEVVVANWREDFRHIGTGTVGITFGVFRAANDRFKLSVAAHIGAGFLTPDRSEFALAMVGPHFSYLFTRTVEGYVDVSYGLRFRKLASHGVYGSAGVRFLFD